MLKPKLSYLIVGLAIAWCALSAWSGSPGRNLDLLIVNGQIYDGSEHAPVQAAVGIQGDRIVFVGDPDSRHYNAANMIDARGMIVTPGFIDPHTHSLGDLQSVDARQNLNYLTQGVTTVFVGNDGDGSAEVERLAAQLDAGGIGTNVAFLVGHGAVRSTVMGRDNRAPTQDELQAMADLVEQAMLAGAFGLSTGLYYTPGNYAETDEVVTLALVAARHDGIYETHLRDESSYNIGFLAALDEALEIGARAGIPVHVGHIKALGVDVWGQSQQAIDKINAARQQGQAVTADQYPWEASGTHLRNAVMPRWALADSEEHYQARLRNEQVLERIYKAIAENIRRRGGAHALLIVSCPDERFVGKHLDEAGEFLGMGAVDAALHILRMGSSRVISFNMDQGDIENFMRQPWVMTSSDGNERHPRKYASFPKKYEEYVVGRQLMSIAQFVRRSTGLTADTFGLQDRGYLRQGYFADIAIIDPERFGPRADYLNWNRLSTGVQYLFVNGTAVIADGQVNDSLSGRALRKNRRPSKPGAQD